MKAFFIIAVVATLSACAAGPKPLWQQDLDNIRKVQRGLAPAPIEQPTDGWHNPREDYGRMALHCPIQ